MRRAGLTASFTACLVAKKFAIEGKAKPTSYKGLDVTPLGVERAKNVALIDCPPGTNTVRGNAREGEEFAVVTLVFKVTPSFDAKTSSRNPC